MRSEPGGRRADEGFTLVEVLVALAVVSVAMAGLGTFFVNGSLTVARQRDARQASQLASSGLEQVRALDGNSLNAERGSTGTLDQWNQALAGTNPHKKVLKPYLDSMKRSWDAEGESKGEVLPGAGADAPISTATQTMIVGGLTFHRAMYLGECEVYLRGNIVGDDKKADCVNGDTAKKPSEILGTLRYFRVVVLVTWANRSCPANECSYVASTLVSRGSDPTFDTKRPWPAVKTTSLTFYLNEDNSHTLDASGGYLPNEWKFQGGWPAGLELDKNGLVRWKPTTLSPSPQSSTVVVTDKQLRSDTKVVTWKVVRPPTVAGPPTPKSHVGEAVSLQATGANGVSAAGTYTYKATGLPPGLVINAETGAITGAATTVGTYTVTITVKDDNERPGTGTYIHTVYPALAFTAPPEQQVTLGSAVSATAGAKGGDGKYSYTATGLPQGVTINQATGVLTGIPTVPGRYMPTITVTDGLTGTATGRFALVVTSPTMLAITLPAGADVKSVLNQAASVAVTTNAGTLGISGTSITAAGLPPGITWNGRDALAGRPTQAGTYLVTLTAASTNPVQTTPFTFVWTVS